MKLERGLLVSLARQDAIFFALQKESKGMKKGYYWGFTTGFTTGFDPPKASVHTPLAKGGSWISSLFRST